MKRLKEALAVVADITSIASFVLAVVLLILK